VCAFDLIVPASLFLQPWRQTSKDWQAETNPDAVGDLRYEHDDVGEFARPGASQHGAGQSEPYGGRSHAAGLGHFAYDAETSLSRLLVRCGLVGQ
jgi:hypothetical protein